MFFSSIGTDSQANVKKSEPNDFFFTNDEPVMGVDLDKRAAYLAQMGFKKLEKEFSLSPRKTLSSELVGPLIEQSEQFLTQLPSSVEALGRIAASISLSRKYENSSPNPPCVYPSVTEVEPLIKLALEIRENYIKFKSNRDFIKRFDFIFKKFLDDLEAQIRESALVYRQAELINIKDSSLPADEKEIESARLSLHIEALTSKQGQHWLELRDALNLSRLPHVPRVCTREEIEFFQFITLIYDRMHSIKETFGDL